MFPSNPSKHHADKIIGSPVILITEEREREMESKMVKMLNCFIIPSYPRKTPTHHKGYLSCDVTLLLLTLPPPIYRVRTRCM